MTSPAPTRSFTITPDQLVQLGLAALDAGGVS